MARRGLLLAFLAGLLCGCSFPGAAVSGLPQALSLTPTFTPFQPLPSATLPGAVVAYPAPSQVPVSPQPLTTASLPGETPVLQSSLVSVWIDPALPPAFRAGLAVRRIDCILVELAAITAEEVALRDHPAQVGDLLADEHPALRAAQHHDGFGVHRDAVEDELTEV